ncbi:MAG: hypothetical protein JNL67_10865 [Planctomycetaceae bacterium]|nr:hypothetical protein [Planctomycetaceae bacterium]
MTELREVDAVGGMIVFQLNSNRLARLVGGLCATFVWASSFVGVHAQFHQTQPNQTGPLGPTIPGQTGAGAMTDANAGFRTDSTLLPGLRPFVNSPANASTNLSNVPATTSATDLSGGQSQGLPVLSNRQNQFQDPTLATGDWRGAATQGTNTGLGPSTNPAFGANTQFGSRTSEWQSPNIGFPPGNGLQSPAPLVPQSNGEMLAPSDRMLANDQMAIQRQNQTIADRQRRIADWDKGIDSNQFLDPFVVRRPRLVTKGSDGLEDRFARDSSIGETTAREVVYNQESSTEVNANSATKSSSLTKSEKSMDNFMWWLMVCSVMANLILFYLLYDSRAKYLNLADELQSRFFREG